MLMATILVIDDDSDMRALLDETLRAAGHVAVLAGDGREGMAKLRASMPDLVITDLFMPNQEGLETIVELRRDFRHVSIIAISGDASARAMLSIARRLGAVEVLVKPFQPDELLSAVTKTLQLKSKTK
jgi:CheY-like chemotaxis protein